jgi:carbamoyl-phosphate synthase large subunit
LSASTDRLAQAGLRLLANDPQVIHRFSDKATTFEHLVGLGLQIPRTIRVTSERDLAEIGMPCVIKPATGSGGSVLVALVSTPDEAMAHAATIARCGGCPIAQEYIAANEGEFTVGVLCLPDGKIIGSVALRRSLDSKLSTAFRGRGGVISSGYSQGYIADFPAIRAQAEAISTAVGNRGAMNIQGRVRNGQFIPFEINPRFSASTYLRAMAGFNEVDLMLRHVALGETASPEPLREGWYLRSLTECFLPANRLKDHALDH